MAVMFNFRTPVYDDVAIGGIWLSTYGVYIAGTEGIQLSLLPSKTVNTTTVVGREGESFLGAMYNKRELTLPAYIEDIGKLEEFKKLLIPDKLQWFQFKNTDTRIKAVISNEIMYKPHGRQGTFDLVLTCPDPHFYESVPIVNTYNNPTRIKILNIGNRKSFPRYEITARGTVHVGVNSEVMTLQFGEEYETLIVDTKFKEVRKGDTENRLFSNTNFKFPTFMIGDNLIAITGDCTKITITPNNRWI